MPFIKCLDIVLIPYRWFQKKPPLNMKALKINKKKSLKTQGVILTKLIISYLIVAL